jgi:hypothetical protein
MMLTNVFPVTGSLRISASSVYFDAISAPGITFTSSFYLIWFNYSVCDLALSLLRFTSSHNLEYTLGI